MTVFLSREGKTTVLGDVTPDQPLAAFNGLDADGPWEFSCGDHASLTAEFLERVRAAGYETHCWTINDPARARALAKLGMQSITTDRPAAIREGLRRKPGE